MQNIQKIFNSIGGEFTSPIDKIAEKNSKIKAFIFDWDGVFHSGRKDENSQTTFSEIDAMGSNLLRFSFWLTNNKKLPYTGIISGSENKTAEFFAKRQHYNFIFTKIKNKNIALDKVCKKFMLKYEQIAFIFDDVLDLSIAKKCGLRFLVRRNSNPLFLEYVKDNKYCDYITGNQGDNNAIREISELIIALNGNFNEVMANRIEFSKIYQEYWEERNTIEFELE